MQIYAKWHQSHYLAILQQDSCFNSFTNIFTEKFTLGQQSSIYMTRVRGIVSITHYFGNENLQIPTFQ